MKLKINKLQNGKYIPTPNLGDRIRNTISKFGKWRENRTKDKEAEQLANTFKTRYDNAYPTSRKELPLISLESTIAEWLPGTGDAVEVMQVAGDIKSGNPISAAITTALALVPGTVATKVSKELPDFKFEQKDFIKSSTLPTLDDVEDIIANGNDIRGAYMDALEFLQSPEYRNSIERKNNLARRMHNVHVNEGELAKEGYQIDLKNYNLELPVISGSQKINFYNSPDKKLYGTYNTRTHELNANIAFPEKLKQMTYHETLHDGKMGQPNITFASMDDFRKITGPGDIDAFNRWYAGKLYKSTNNPQVSNYMLAKDAREALVHLRTLGYMNNIHPNTPYPGRQQATETIKSIMDNTSIPEIKKYEELNFDRPDRIWRALQGLYKGGGRILGQRSVGVTPNGVMTNIEWVKDFNDYRKIQSDLDFLGIEHLESYGE